MKITSYALIYRDSNNDVISVIIINKKQIWQV